MNAMTWLFGESPETLFGGAMNLSQDMFLPCIFGGRADRRRNRADHQVARHVGRHRHHREVTDALRAHPLFARNTDRRFVRRTVRHDRFGRLALAALLVSHYLCLVAVIDYILDGASYDKLLFIVSDRREQIREYILERMGRGGTYLKASGLYTARDKEVIFVVVSRGEVSMVRSMVHEIDPTAFVVIVDADETYGDGFKPFPQKE